MRSYRVERDPLGDVRVPAKAYYGGQTARAVENFPISGLTAPPALVTATVLVKKAAAEANRTLGRLSPSVARAIVKAADEILSGQLRDQFVVDVYQAGAGTSHNMNANEVLANRAAEILGERRGTYTRVHPNDHVNMGQSTNDVYPTATRLAILFAVRDLLSSARDLSKTAQTEEPRVRYDPQSRPHAPPGRRADHARPGIWRLRRQRRARGWRARAHGRTAPRAEPGRHGGRHGAQRRRRLHARGDRQPPALYEAAVARGHQPLPRHAEHGRRARLLGRAAAAVGRGRQGRFRSAAPEHGAARRHRRNSAAGGAAGLLHHAGQGESVGAGNGQPGLLPGDRVRCRRSWPRPTPDNSS